ncbi:MAG: sugar phosphate isomerase/epimerase family protein [Planctomycetota bacterium]
MKKGISYWSFSEDLGSPNPPYDQVFRFAKQHGYDAVEVSVSEDPAHILRFGATTDEIEAVRDAATAAGIEISSVASGDYWGVSPTSGDPAMRKKALGFMKEQLRIAAELEAGTILVVPGAVQPQFLPQAEHVPYQEAWKRASSVIGQAAKTAEKHGVVIGIENVWNRMLLSPLEMRSFCEQFQSDFVKCYLDVGNVLFNGFPQDWIEILGRKDRETKRSYLAALHVKDFRTHFFLGGETGVLAEVREGCKQIARGSGWTGAYAFCDLGEGDLPQDALRQSLKKVGFKGYLTVEMLPPTKGVVAKSSQAMDKLMGRV